MNFYIKKQNFLAKKILTGIVASVITMGLLYVFGNEIRNAFYFTFQPAMKVLWQTGNRASVFTRSLIGAEGLKKENDALRQTNEVLLSEIVSLKESTEAVQSVKDIIKNTKEDNVALVLAEVTGLDLSLDIMTINKGSADGILENMPVISSQKVLYGKVFKTYNNFSRVMLISNHSSVVDAKIQSDNPSKPPIHGAVRGSGNALIYLDLVPSDAEIKEGDVVVSSGLEGVFPKNLLIGKITARDNNDLKPFQTAQIQPFFDIKNVNFLFVVTDYQRKK